MQPSQDLLSPARRPLDVEDYIDIVRRHKSWILGPAFAALVLAVLLAFRWPDTYVSEATLQVVPPQVPERLVPSNVNLDMQHRINLLAQRIRSREPLTNIIVSNKLFEQERQNMPMVDVVEMMNSRIRISPVTSFQTQGGRQSITAFRVSFAHSDRFQAQKVTQELVNAFMAANIQDLSSQSHATTDFLSEQWEAARNRLQELDNRLQQFRVKNAGRLPDQMQSNMQALNSLQTQLQGVNDAISRIGQDKLLLESQLRIYKDQLASLEQGGDQFGVTMQNEQLAQTERQIVTLETDLSGLRERYRNTHPDVKSAEAQLAMLKRRRDDLLRQEQQAKPAEEPRRQTPAQARTARELEVAVARIESQIQARDLEMADRTKSQARLIESINNYNARIQSSPLLDREYSELTRDHALARERYEELNRKKSASEIATNLENRGQGEKLQLLESASLPERPTEPNRLLIVGAGLGIGLMLGVFVAGAREMKDTSLKSLKDARAYTNLPVLGTVPLLENDLVVRRKRRLVWLAWSAAFMIGVIAIGGSIYQYYSNKM